MATNISIPTYGFVNHILALNEGNWRRFFKPFITDSVQSGLATIAGANMTVYVSAGECRCGAVMGILDGMIALDVANGDSTYDRIDSVIVQYTYGEPSTLAVAIIQGTPSTNPVPPTLTKVYDTLWQMEIAQILVPSGATSSSEFTITDKRVIYESIESIIDDNAESEERVWSSQKTREEIVSLSTEIYNSLNTKADVIERTVSGDIITITDGGDNLPVKELVVDIEPVQDLHGYDYPWPAGGGKNKFDVANVTFTDGLRNADGSHQTSSSSHYTSSIPVLPETEYTISGTLKTSSANWRLYYLGESESWIERTDSITSDIYTFTTPSTCYYIQIQVPYQRTLSDCQLELGSTATSYAPYSNVCPISGHSTATVTRTGKNLWDVGIMTESTTWQKVTLTLPEGTYTMSSNIALDSPLVTHFRKSSSSSIDNYNKVYNGHPITITITEGEAVQVVYRRASGTDLFSSYQYQLELGSTSSTYELYRGQTITINLGETRYGAILNVLTGMMTVTDGYIASYNGETLPSTWISDRDVYAEGTTPTTGAQVVYKLASPQTVQLSSSKIQTLLGQNAIWSNTGNILNLTYRADMKTYVDEHVAEANLKTRQMMTTVTTKMVAPDNLVIGDIVIVNDNLYKVINSNIASGETMVVGTNVEQITLTEYIQSLI